MHAYSSTFVSKQVYTPQEVADILEVSRKTVYRKLRDGKLNGHKLEEHWRITRSDLEKYLGPALAAEMLPNYQE